MNFFKGYVRTKNKRSIDRFKDNAPLRTLREVEKLEEYAGILAENTILIDVDNEEQSEILLKIIEDNNIICQVRKTTRGMHFFFKNNGAKCFEQCHTGIKLACGITADIKTGKTNSYSVLKNNGVAREIIYDKFEDETYMDAPYWLNVVNTESDFFNLGVGDGRNSALFKYILNLQKANFTKEQIIFTLQIINKYIFKKPLSDSEFETLTRDEAFNKELEPNFFDGKTFLFDVFAQHLVNNLPIKRINGLLHIYNNGYYQDGQDKIERAMIDLIPTLNRAKRTEVLDYINLLVADDTPPAPSNLICFKNGVLNIDTNELLDFSADISIANKIPYDYNVNAKYDLLDKTLNNLACGNENIRIALEEMAGYTLYRNNAGLRKAFILIGDKRNGKSTYLSVLQKMLGDENISALDLKELTERFKTAEIYRKLANIGDDIADDFIGDMATFKKLVSGDRVTAERKGQDPFNFNNYAKLIFSANNLPRVKDNTGAVLDRLSIIPFNAVFDKNSDNYDPFIKEKLQSDECIEYLILLSVNALKRVLERKEFTKCAEIDAQLQEYNEINNPILEFYQDWDEVRIQSEPIENIYAKYKEFCLVGNYTPISRIQFSRNTTKHYNLKTTRRRVNYETKKYFTYKD